MTALFFAVLLAANPAFADATVGEAAPDFTLTDLDGNEVSLTDQRGKTVVVEWFNPGCPYVVYAHGEGPLKTMAKSKTDDGVVWLAVNSGAPGKQGHGVETNKKAVSEWSVPHPVLIDASGEVGKAYGAKATPHMYVIDAEGTLVYAGALDNAPMGKAEGEYVNYVDAALSSVAAGQAVEVSSTKAYGCSVKYGS